MIPHSLGIIEVGPPKKTKAELDKEALRNIPKGQVRPETTTPACPRRRVADFPPDFLKPNHIAHLEQNQMIRSCCRHPENHEVEALKSHPDEPAPDIYIFHCGCGRKHRFFCVGLTDTRPTWA